MSDYTKSYLPDYRAGLIGVLVLGITFFIKDKSLVVLSFVWIFWYIVGTLNTVSSALFLGQHYANMPIDVASIVYMVGVLFFVLGLKSGEYINLHKKIGACIEIGKYSAYFIILFPYAWLLSMYSTVGYIPVLLGIDITDDMYEINYGFLYPYTAIIALSCIYALYNIIYKSGNYIWWLIFISSLLISFADGKRVVGMIVAGAAVPMIFNKYDKDGWYKIYMAMGSAVLLYVIMAIVRQGGSTDRYESDAITKYMAVGVEFRDFVYSINIIEPGNIDGYSWHKSALAAMMNESVLSFFGIDKKEYVSMGSAYVWAKIFNSNFGIRTGIVSELWFAYEYYYILFIYTIGVISTLCLKISKTLDSEILMIIMWGIIGMGYLAIVGQATAIAGTLTVYFYVYVLITAEVKIFGGVK
jgi:hypothetical protein